MTTNSFCQVLGVNGNLVTGITDGAVRMNEIAYILLDDSDKRRSNPQRLKAEVIRIRGREFDAQVFEDTTSIKAGQLIELSGDMLSIELGPGLLGGIFDGLGNPLPELADKDGYFLKRGSYLDTIDKSKSFDFQPLVEAGNIVMRGHALGVVKEGLFEHRIMVPFRLLGQYCVLDIIGAQSAHPDKIIARLENLETKARHDISMIQKWPVKIALKAYQERLVPTVPLTTKVRIVDALFPIAEGGTACIPGPFGSGKTVFQQSVSRYADADVVIIAACGERAGEVVETLREFPELNDPKTGRSLMERTIIICNTSSMPVAAREASVYTAITMAEYYRQMGLSVLVLADSTSRWAQAIREMSGRLEEIPGEEAFPAYLGSMIASFYERAGRVRIVDPRLGEKVGSITLIGTVSPAGGNFEEPVTQSTLAVVGCFLGLTYARSYAKRFPAITPLDSWSKYLDPLTEELDKRYFIGFVSLIKHLKKYYRQAQALGDQMKVVGEEDLSISEFVHYLKAEFFDAVFLQQNAFSSIDAAPSEQRVASLLQQVSAVIEYDFKFSSKIIARQTMARLSALFRDANLMAVNSPDYQARIASIEALMMKTGESHEKVLS